MSWQTPSYDTDYLLSIREASGGNPAGIVRELVLAYNERCVACGMDNDDGNNTDLTLEVPSEGDTALHYEGLFKQLQEGLDDLVGSARWWNHASYESESFITLANAAWRTLAGLPSGSGNFRRVESFTDGDFTQPIFATPGPPEENDYFGPWIIEDIQNGLDNLRFARPLKISSIDRVGRGSDGNLPYDGNTLADAKAAACSGFAAASNVLFDDKESGFFPLANFNLCDSGPFSLPDAGALTVTYINYPDSIDNYRWYLGNHTVKIKVDTPTDALSKRIEVWGQGSSKLRPGQYNSGSWGVVIGSQDRTKMVDVITSGASHTTDQLGNADFNCPVDEVGWGSLGEFSTSWDGINNIGVIAVIKWDFTNRSYSLD